jgi:hypothetical protein
MLSAMVGFVQALFFGCHGDLPRSGPWEGDTAERSGKQ